MYLYVIGKVGGGEIGKVVANSFGEACSKLGYNSMQCYCIRMNGVR